MRIGILADIHEQVECLEPAIEMLRDAGADRIITLGDLCETGRRLGDTVRLLQAAGVTGVWGNHDYGLCRDLSPQSRTRYEPTVLEYMATLTPRVVLENCYFSHIEPWLDPEDLAQLWHFEDGVETPERLARSFTAASQRVLFMGHLHRWFAATPAGPIKWKGDRVLTLDPAQRYLIVIHAASTGHCALFDTVTNELTPMLVDTFVVVDSELD